MATLVILGGYGNTGRALTRLLLQHSDVSLVLVGRDGDKARRAAAEWNDRFPGLRARGEAADASDGERLRQLFRGTELVVAASSTSPSARVVAEAALDAGIDYIDPQFSRAKVAALRELAPRIQAAGRCFVTDAGFHPGLPALLVRYAARRFDALRSARVGSVIQIDWKTLNFSDSTLDELVSEFREMQMMHFRAGRWQTMGWIESFKPVWMDFGGEFGRRYTMPMLLEEMRPLPDMFPGLQDTGFFVGGFNWVVDWLLMPLGVGLLWISPEAGGRAFARMLEWGLRRFSRPPFGTLLQLEAQGLHDGAEH
ncbi:MAG TPA: saccharopine dehydrogenase NADP-binding domain-containing protein, partial [Anaerolineales bacterium]|nr:saccharopine dehydrogenase NADP-binding domain-containing protein [Anaerolineales bacterium]